MMMIIPHQKNRKEQRKKYNKVKKLEMLKKKGQQTMRGGGELVQDRASSRHDPVP